MMIYEGKGERIHPCALAPGHVYKAQPLCTLPFTHGWDSFTELGTTAEMIRSAMKGLNTGHVSHRTSWYAEDLA